jgi:glucose/arabinose dehydrogenase
MRPALAAAQTSGLVAAYGFNAGAGTSVTDASGNDNTGTIQGANWTPQGKFGGALEFNGTNGYVSVANSLSLDISGSELTLSMWINPQPLSGGDSLVLGKFWNATMTSPLYQYGLKLASGREPFFYLGTSGGVRSVRMGSNLTLNQWSHLAVVFGGSQVRFYVNGMLVRTRPLSASIQARGNPLRIGADLVPAQFHKGFLDEVRIYNRALTQTAIQSDMNTAVGGGGTPNTAPTITSIAAQTINEDTATGALGFTVGDAEMAAGSLTVTASSSNPTLVPGGTIAFGGSGAARTVTVTPAAGQSGTATITVSVSDGQLSTSTSFQLTVTAVNDAPTITSIPNRTTSVGTAVGPLSFTVGDIETAAGSLTVSGSSSNPTLVPGGNIAFVGSGAIRTVTVTPAAGQSGTATITVSVSDGQASTSTAFQLTVTATSVGLAAGWNFNEGSGSFANDISGHNNTAVIQGVALWSAGEYGGGITLSGSSFLAVSSSPSLDISGSELTLSMWLKPQQLSGGDSVVIGKFWNTTMTSPSYQYGLELDAGSTPHFYVGTTGGLVGAAMGSPLPFGQWSHLGVVFDGSQVLFYLNGALVSTRPLAANITARGNPLNIGADANAAQLFNGTLDDVRVYGRVLTQAEIQADMNTPLGGVGGSDPTPPTVAISSPANSAQVSDIVVLAADAADNIGVAGVQFLVDGIPVGAEDSEAPYGLSWDTRTVANGAHIVTARARDTSGNVTVSAPVTVNVANTNFFVNEILATGFDLPTNIEFLPDGRMLVVELQGIIKVLPPPYLQPDPTPFLQLANIGSAGVQQGIYDIALDPAFGNNRFYYVFYTAGSPNRDRLSRFTANASLTGTVAGSELVLYQDPQSPHAEHHGGAITFGNDGKIYFTTGEHFNAGDAQLLSSPRGKIHRINKDGTIPTDNPFYDGPGPNWDSIWALGLRNPFRAYYDAPTGRLFVGDVGGNDYAVAKEEVNLGVAGANYGWPNFEGPCPAPCRSPIYFYPHNGRDASVTGGFVYRGTQFPSAYQGSYFFADYTQNWIRRLTFDANGNVNGVFNFEPANGSVDGPYGDIVHLTEGPDGALYYVDLGYSDIGGSFGISKIRRIRYVQNNQAPVAVAAASPTKGPRPLTVSFSSNGSADPEGQPLAYAWTFGDGSTSTEASPTHTYTQNGNYTVRLSVSDGVRTTLAPPLVINVGTPPTVTILSPPDGLFFRAGDVIAFSGDASDLEDGPLSAGAFSWSLDFLHEGHVHPGLPVTGTKSGSFTIPVTGHDFSGNTRYRITLTVTDSDGLQSSRAVIAYPEKVNLSFGTVPDGLTLGLDGIARTAPFVHDTLIGFTHTIEAKDQLLGTTNYVFGSWSDGGTQQHAIIVPPTPQSLTATFTESPLPPGVVAAWTFSGGAGRSANDATGNGNTATFVNGTAWAAGPHDNSVSFNGVDGYLSVGNSPSLNISGSELTLSMWINPQPLSGGDSVVLGKFWNATMTSPFYQYGLELAGGQEPVFYLGTNAGVFFARMGSILSVGQWSHLAVVFNGSQVRFYVNGTLVGTAALSGSIQARGNPLHIGADITPAQFYRGFLDEVRIYNRALTASEIQRDMTTALAGP